MTTIEELRAAAAKLRETATNATPGPWTDHSAEGTAWPILVHGGPIKDDPTGHRDTVIKVHEFIAGEEVVMPSDVAWIALANPALAEPLAAWLDEFAKWAEETFFHDLTGRFHEPCGDTDDECGCFDHALAVARALNGTTS